MKVVLVQLPVPDNRLANLPLALGYLKASAQAAALPGVQIELLEANVMNRGGDAFVADAILAHNPDLVGFSLYTWNSSRVLKIAAQLKQLAPETLIVGGGPEVNRDGDFILASPHFDFLVVGEGERTFVELLKQLNSGRRAVSATHSGLTLVGSIARGLALPDLRSQATASINEADISPRWIFGDPQTALDDVNTIPSVYLSDALAGHVGRYMSIELSRWCPSRCTFCYYGRQDIPRGGKRYFDIERVRQELLWGMAHGVEQVHFVEANFNTLPHLSQLYETIRNSGANRKLNFYAELRGEAIDATHAATLAACNFGTVEVGLQSAVPEVMAQVKRKNHLPRLVQGVHNLRDQGIEVFLDVILGLPGETPETFRQTLDFMDENRLHPYDMFHLQILSGTELKAQAVAGQHGLKWQSAPPYFVLETENLSFEQLCRLRSEAFNRKSATEADQSAIPGHTLPDAFALVKPPIRSIDESLSPDFLSEPVERVYIDCRPGIDESTLARLPQLARKLASEVNLWLRLDSNFANADDDDVIANLLQTLSQPNPSGVWNIFLETDQPLPSSKLRQIRQAIYHTEDYLDRLAVFARQTPAIDPANWPTVRIYQLLPYNDYFRSGSTEAAASLATSKIIGQLELSAEATTEAWQAQIVQALEADCIGLHLITQPDCKPAKLKKALHNLADSGKLIWLSEASLAAGWVYAQAEDSATALANLRYPPTLSLDYTGLAKATLDQNSLLDAAFRWAAG